MRKVSYPPCTPGCVCCNPQIEAIREYGAAEVAKTMIRPPGDPSPLPLLCPDAIPTASLIIPSPYHCRCPTIASTSLLPCIDPSGHDESSLAGELCCQRLGSPKIGTL